MPYYREAELPFVFSGINWDASIYGAPYSNTAGMVEVSLIDQNVNYISRYSKGTRLGFLTSETPTGRKNRKYYAKYFNIHFEKEYFVGSFGEWKEAFLKLQNEVDLLIIGGNGGLADWDDAIAKQFTLKNTKIPSATPNAWMVNFSLLGVTRVPEELGEWSAITALKILDGTDPKDIPLAINKKGNLIINLNIADKLDLILEPSMLRNAQIID